jgi:hypothetical protein
MVTITFKYPKFFSDELIYAELVDFIEEDDGTLF